MIDQHRPDSDPPPADLRRALDTLPSEIEPEHDLWPAIAGRLEPRRPNRFRRLVALGGLPAPRRALAAALYMALGAAITWMAMSGERAVETPATGPGTSQTVDASASTWVPTVVPASVGALPNLAAIEVDFLRARESMWRHVLARREALDPATLAVVEKNLAIIDRAIRDLHTALEADPGNSVLERRLIDSHRRGLDLLRQLSQEV